MPDFGTPVAQNVQAPNFTQTLSGLMGLQQQQQNLQVGANNAQAAQQTMQERQRVTQMMQSGVDDQGNNIRDAQGNPDPEKMGPALGRMAPLTGQAINQSLLATHTAKIGLQTAALSLDSKQREALMAPVQAMATNPEDPTMVGAVTNALNGWATAHPEMQPVVNDIKTNLIPHIQNAQPADRARMANSMAALLQGGQPVQTQPQSTSVDNGQQTLVGTVAPPVTGGAFTPTTGVQHQPGPTTPVVDPRNGQPALYGARPPLAATSAPVATGLAPGASGNLQNNYDEMNRHFASLQDGASGAPLVSALTGNIKALAAKAITGTESDRKSYLNGMLNALGVGDKASGDTQADTDLLQKQMAQLNLTTPASSDAARALVGAARPNSHMSAAAIGEATDQIASQVQANMAIRNKLAPTKMANNGQGDPVAYQAQRQQLESIADPRAWQYMNLGPGTPAAKQFLQKLQLGDRAKLRANVGSLDQAGMLP